MYFYVFIYSEKYNGFIYIYRPFMLNNIISVYDTVNISYYKSISLFTIKHPQNSHDLPLARKVLSLHGK
jgi:hypothetical protein